MLITRYRPAGCGPIHEAPELWPCVERIVYTPRLAHAHICGDGYACRLSNYSHRPRLTLDYLTHMEKDRFVAVGISEVPTVEGWHAFTGRALVACTQFHCAGVQFVNFFT